MQLIKLDVARRFTFCTAHRLIGEGAGRCGNVHGRNYTLWVHARSKGARLNDLGFVVDFGELRTKIELWLNEYWDHAYIAVLNDPMLQGIQALKLKSFVMPVNSTMEHMAMHLLNSVFPRLFTNADYEIYKVELYETENAKVTAELQ